MAAEIIPIEIYKDSALIERQYIVKENADDSGTRMTEAEYIEWERNRSLIDKLIN